MARVIYGNLALVYGSDVSDWPEAVWEEAAALAEHMVRFEILPAGRHLWASGVKGRQFLFNCHAAGFTNDPRDHVDFMLMRLAEGGGVGANYSTRYLQQQGAPVTEVEAHIVCDPSHPDYRAMADAGLLSDEYAPDWPGAFEIEDTREGWSDAVASLLADSWDHDTRHRQRVFDVSRIRWSGARLKTTGGTASGPEPLARALVSIAETLTRSVRRNGVLPGWERQPHDLPSLSPVEAMEIDHAIADAIVAGGTRRSARMSICHWRDPHIGDFLNCKADGSSHWTTNISVEIDDLFIELVSHNRGIAGYTSASVHDMRRQAHQILEAVVSGMLTNGEPGLWNSSLSNVGEPNEVITTNPCGEIALEAWENCNLGHVNMSAFVREDMSVDSERLARAHRLVTRFLIRATYGDVIDHKQAHVLARNRRIGVGHFGVQGFLAKQERRYSDAGRDEYLSSTLTALACVVENEAASYAHQLRIPRPVKTRTVAPTGTTAKMPGVPEGIHPIYARHFLRRVRYSTSDANQARQVKALAAAGHHTEPDKYASDTVIVEFLTEDSLVAEVESMGIHAAIVESADEINLSDMLRFQSVYQTSWADNAVSFTVNVPAEPHQEKAIFEMRRVPKPTKQRTLTVMHELIPFLPFLKGTTLMVDGSREQAPYERISEWEFRSRLTNGEKATIESSFDEECATGACPVK